MKKNRISIFAVGILFLTGLISCAGKNEKSAASLVTDSLHISKSVHLDNDTAKPYADFKANLVYVKQAAKPYIKDSINKAITVATFGDEYQTIPFEQAVDSFKNSYFTQFNDEVGPTYKQDFQENPTQTKLRWYNYTKVMKSNFIFNENDVLSYRVNITDNTGGAHGMHESYFLNFNALTGKVIHLDDIFTGDYEPALTQQLLAELEHMMKVKTQKDLEDLGFFASDSLAPTENFYVTEKEICFYYNIYEIAPYAVGSLNVKIPFDAVREMLNTNHNPLAEILE